MTDTIKKTPLVQMNKDDLMAEAKKLELPTGGTKADLITRIFKTRQAQEAPVDAPSITQPETPIDPAPLKEKTHLEELYHTANVLQAELKEVNAAIAKEVEKTTQKPFTQHELIKRSQRRKQG